MEKSLLNVFGAFVIFGPSIVAGPDRMGANHLVGVGTVMFSIGLAVMLRTISRQQKLIEQLWSERRSSELNSIPS